MNQRPSQCQDCPLNAHSVGFCLDWGNPQTALLAIHLEAPGKSELSYSVTKRYGLFGDLDESEHKRRIRAYPRIPDAFLRKGAALVGASWNVLAGYALGKYGIARDRLYISNTIRCLWRDPAHPDQNYPTGELRKAAEHHCRRYDPDWRRDFFKGKEGLVVLGIHPASLIGSKRDLTPLPLLIRSARKAAESAQQGIKTVLCLGGKAAKMWLGYGEQITRWQGHYAWVKEPHINANSAATLEPDDSEFIPTPSLTRRTLRKGHWRGES